MSKVDHSKIRKFTKITF